MGRKPHRLIQEHFVRGTKLEDSSNRYQHTCKSCGEKFPKGRIDGLISHILRKCPGISRETRQQALLELVDKPNQNGSYNPVAVSMRNEQLGTESTEGSTGYNQNMSALETLAEVSRQQLDTADAEGHNEQQAEEEESSSVRKRKRRRLNEDQQRFQNTFTVRSEQQHFDPQLLTAGQGHNNPKTAAQDDLFRGIAQYAAQDVPSIAPTARMIPDQLALTASAANQMIPNADDLPETTAPETPNIDPVTPVAEASDETQLLETTQIDPQLEQETPQDPSTPSPQFPVDRSLMLAPRSAPSNPDMPHVHFFNNFLLGSGPNKKVRGRFSDVRRKEVQEVRKQGACIRCRMLKKPCSGGVPCATCQNVESARLWKIPCLRTRMADELDLFSAGVQAIMAFQEINQAKEPETFISSNRDIVATLFPDARSTSSLTLNSILGQGKNFISEDYGFNASSLSICELELVDPDSQDVAEKLGIYLQQTREFMIDNEKADFMRVTLRVAADLVSQKMDPLLSRALDLWVATRVLSDPTNVWTVYLTPSQDNLNGGSPDANIDLNGDRQGISPSHYLNHRLVTLQLKGFAEKYASQVAKHLLNDLEKRLLQRQQNSNQNFEAFITTVILLNCMERMCWFYNGWAAKMRLSDPGSNELSASDIQQLQTHTNDGWPIGGRLPHELVEKGRDIANLVVMLLKMRGIPPPTVADQDGVIRVSPSKAAGTPKSHLQSSQQTSPDFSTSTDELVAHLAQAAAAVDEPETIATTPARDEDTSLLNSSVNSTPRAFKTPYSAAAINWFDKINVTEGQLRRAQADDKPFDPDDCRNYDLRYTARLLLPEIV